MDALLEIGHLLSIGAIPLITAITLHEAAHGWAAEKLGDDTARRMGRVSFNPLRHVDPFGTIILPGMLLLMSAFGGPRFVIGWAKPVPVAFHRLRNPKRDMVLVALAGPAINIILAILVATAMHLLLLTPDSMAALWIWENLDNALFFNILLACFNMLPIPPLDGGRVVTGLLPAPLAWRFARIERAGLFILIGIIFVVPWIAEKFGMQINPLADVLLPVINVVHGAILKLTGW